MKMIGKVGSSVRYQGICDTGSYASDFKVAPLMVMVNDVVSSAPALDEAVVP